jgi:hypothetical protein
MPMETWIPIENRLCETFLDGELNSIGGSLLMDAIKKETQYGAHLTSKWLGYERTINSYFNFFIETLTKATHQTMPSEFGLMYLLFFSAFRRHRAAQTLWSHGFPIAGFALLRDLKDSALCLGAIIDGYITANEVLGLNSSGAPQATERASVIKEWRSIQKKALRKAMAKMVGPDSGLPNENIAILEKWRDTFHDEVHGGRISMLQDLETLYMKRQRPSFAPVPYEDDMDVGLYTNRSIEIGWMICRTLPFLQSSERSFGQGWADNWNLLDQAFRLQVSSVGKAFSIAILRLVDMKFDFTPNTAYRRAASEAPVETEQAMRKRPPSADHG